MSGSDYSLKSQPPTQTGNGGGHTFTWRCAQCNEGNFSLIGRGLRRVCGLRQWVCVGCKTSIDKGRG